jgi:RHS repeat-associated protein
VLFLRAVKRVAFSAGAGVTAVAVAVFGAPAASAATAGPAQAAAPAQTVTAAPGALAAEMAAARQGSRVEITDERTSFSQTFANPDGTQTYVESWSPVWVRQGSSWARPDATLAQNADGSWSPAAAVNGLTLSGGGNQALATITAGGQSLAVSWPSALPAPSVSGAAATYANVFPGVNLVVTADTSGGFDETLVILNQAAAADPQLAGLDLGVQASGGLAAAAAAGGETWGKAGGNPVFFSPAPLAWDSAGGGSGVPGPGQGAHVAAAGASYAGGKVRLSAPQGLLGAPASSFPVYVDPSYSATSTELAHDMLYSVNPNSSNWSTTQMGVGYTGSGIQRSYFRMSIPSAIYGSNILSATFNQTVTNAQTAASTSHTVTLHSAGPIDTSTTWSNQPGWGTNPPPAPVTFTTASTTPNKAVSWDVTQWMQSAADNYTPNWTVVLTNASETDSAYWVAFSATPTISITYDHTPNPPAPPTITPQYWASDSNLYTSSATPSFSTSATDPDGDNLQYQVQVLSGSTVVASGLSPAAPSGTTGTWADTTPLADGGTYTYQIRAYDGTRYSSWTNWPAFTVETDTPPAPVISCPAYPAGQWSPQVASATCTWNAPLAHMNGYVVQLDGTQLPWTSTTSATLANVAPGVHTLSVQPESAAHVYGPSGTYSFDVGTAAMTSPADQSQTSSSVQLQAAAAAGYTSATFQYRQGTTGSFQPVPGASGLPVTSNTAGVQTAPVKWNVTQTLADDGPVQIQAVFTGNGTFTTPPVTVTLNRVGTGADFGTTTAGPATVGLQSGNAAVSATDVNIASYGSGLTVTRTFNSVAPSVPSIFGPGWTTSLTGGTTTAWTQLASSGSYVVLQAADGSNDTFTKGATNGSTVTWTPQGATVTSGLTLTQNTSSNTFTLTDGSGTVTTLTPSPTAGTYLPSTVTPAGTAGSTGITYDGTSSDASYGDPLLMVAPDPASTMAPTTACPYPASGSTWTAGCRGLAFTYNASGDVTQVSFDYSDNSGAFHSVAVASYSYDSAGKLIKEWDPRLSVPLVTGYTYDETAADPDYGRITQLSPAQAAGSNALAPWTLKYDDAVGDANYGKVLTVSRTHSAANGGATATTTLGYSVPLTTAAGGPLNMDAATIGSWNQADVPASAVAVFPPARIPASPPTAADYQNAAEIDYYDASGREVNTASYVNNAWAVTTTQYDAYGNLTSTLTAADRATALASGSPAATAYALSTVNVYGCDNFGTIDTSCSSNDQQYQVLTDTYGPAHNASVDGTVEQVRTHTAYRYDQAAPNGDTSADGGPYMLTTSQTVSASAGSGIPGTSTADARTTAYTYANSSTSIGWTTGQPLTTVTDPGGLNLTQTSVYNTSPTLYNGASLQTGSYMPSNASGGGAGDTETAYYTADGSSPVAACRNKPEWADLTCQTGPAAQPGTSGLPSLPVTTYTYDDYLNPVTKTEAYGTTGTRTATTTYDAGERPVTQAVTVTGSGMGTAVPKMQIVYSTAAGLLTDSQTLNSSGGVTADIASAYDDFGQVLSYTDAAGNPTAYGYDINGRVTSRNDGKGTETVGYTGSFGSPTTITDSQAGTFSAAYNADGSLLTEQYPGGLTGTYTYDAAGTPVSLSYNGAAWTSPLTDTVVPDAAGNWASQSIADTGTATPLISTQAYSYDNADRVTGAQDTENGQCTTRAYTYDADSNRTRLTTYAPGSGGACQSSTAAGTATTSYDSADRDTSAGYVYNTQGDITTTPAADASGSGNLTATYYANDMLSSQAQGSQAISWALDPTLGRYWTYAQNGVTYTNHYGNDGNSPAWTAGSNGTWTRHVIDFNGSLAAEVTASGVTLELPGLHGDIIATATTSSTATGPASTYAYTEFGTPETGTPGSYGWLGASQISGNALGGQLLMGARAYNTNSGRFSQADPIPGGSANAYDYTFQNPVTNYDLAGTWACQSVPTQATHRICGQYLSNATVKHIETGAEAGGIAGGLRAALAATRPVAEIWAIVVAMIATLALLVKIDDHGHGEWIDVYEARLVWQYPVGVTLGGIIWAWGHSPWLPYWTTLAGVRR